jgi:hypothetical protein
VERSFGVTPKPIQQLGQDDVDVDERHRPGERCDPIRDAVLDALRSLFGRRTSAGFGSCRPDRRCLTPEEVSGTVRGAAVLLGHGRRLFARDVRRGRHASCRFATPAYTINAATHIATTAVRAGSDVCISRSSPLA